jgi:hypothetical protein
VTFWLLKINSLRATNVVKGNKQWAWIETNTYLSLVIMGVAMEVMADFVINVLFRSIMRVLIDLMMDIVT